MSIAGGVAKAVSRAGELDATALQIFTRNQVRWESPPLSHQDAGAFREAVRQSPLRFVCAHASYLINLASSSEKTRQRSHAALVDELKRAELLGCFCLVLHPGSPKDDGIDIGVARVAEGLKRAIDETDGLAVRIALENTAGAGATLGATVAELAEISARVDCPARLGMCLDTAHAHGAGVNLQNRKSVDDLVASIARAFGLSRLYVMHLNDSISGLGSRLDRHAHIGKGQIGEEGFRTLLAHPDIKTVPGIIETPKGDAPPAADRQNLAVLRQLEAAEAAGLTAQQ